MPEQPDAVRLAWERRQPESVTRDAVWRLNCYRESLFLLELAGEDLSSARCRGASQHARDQLLSAVASISANVAEGYGRSTHADRSRFFAYALGSSREAAIWYRAAIASTAGDVLFDRLERLARITRMLLGLLKRIRQNTGKPFDRW